jgi:hypothetical protein
MRKFTTKKHNLKPIKPKMSLLKAIPKPISTRIKRFKPALFGFAYNNEPIKAICGKLDAIRKTKPIFSRSNMRYQYQKRRNGGQELNQKNETNPFVDNFPCGYVELQFTLGGLAEEMWSLPAYSRRICRMKESASAIERSIS